MESYVSQNVGEDSFTSGMLSLGWISGSRDSDLDDPELLGSLKNKVITKIH